MRVRARCKRRRIAAMSHGVSTAFARWGRLCMSDSRPAMIPPKGVLASIFAHPDDVAGVDRVVTDTRLS